MQPQPPFNMLIVGMTGSGKTQFLLDMLETEYNRVFDYIINRVEYNLYQLEPP